MTQKSKRKNTLIILGLVAMLAVGCIAALFTDTDDATNTFTIGDVSIALQEPNWDEDNAANLSPNATVSKDPQVENTSSTNPCYAFLKVEVPKDSTGELFSYTVKSGWSEIVGEKDTSGTDSNIHVYAYGTQAASGMTSLAAGATTGALFDSVTLADRTEFGSSSYDIDITAYAIQTTDLGDGNNTAAKIYDLF